MENTLAEPETLNQFQDRMYRDFVAGRRAPETIITTMTREKAEHVAALNNTDARINDAAEERWNYVTVALAPRSSAEGVKFAVGIYDENQFFLGYM